MILSSNNAITSLFRFEPMTEKVVFCGALATLAVQPLECAFLPSLTHSPCSLTLAAPGFQLPLLLNVTMKILPQLCFLGKQDEDT